MSDGLLARAPFSALTEDPCLAGGGGAALQGAGGTGATREGADDAGTAPMAPTLDSSALCLLSLPRSPASSLIGDAGLANKAARARAGSVVGLTRGSALGRIELANCRNSSVSRWYTRRPSVRITSISLSIHSRHHHGK